jgi:hypothetical protein
MHSIGTRSRRSPNFIFDRQLGAFLSNFAHKAHLYRAYSYRRLGGLSPARTAFEPLPVIVNRSISEIVFSLSGGVTHALR